MSNNIIQASIITIGDEILVGQTIDTNSAHIAQTLYQIGISIQEILSISDKSESIKEALDRCISKSNLVIITGGLGPTQDDITKSTLTDYFNDKLVLNENILNKIKVYFNFLNKEMLDVHHLQAMLPSKAHIIENDLGTASGMVFEKNQTIIMSFPGVPYEMKGLLDKAIPFIQSKFKSGDFYHRTLMTIGIGETAIANMIADIENSLRQNNIGVAYLPAPGMVKVRFTGSQKQKQLIDQKINEVNSILAKYSYGFDDISVEAVVGDLLRNHQKTLSTVESCTGGAIGAKITSVQGASDYYLGSIVSYSNEVKKSFVGVNPEIISKHGAVSEACVLSMAQQGINLLKTDYCVAVSGILGPTGGSKEKPVGTVWIAVADKQGAKAKLFNFKHNRQRNTELTVLYAINELRFSLLNDLSN